MSNLDSLAESIHNTAKNKGFWDDFRNDNADYFFGTKLALITSEVSETLEALRKDQGAEAVTEELADVLIRVLDLYEALRLNGGATNSIHGAVLQKMSKNSNRAHKHGKRY